MMILLLSQLIAIQNAQHCASKFHIPLVTTNPEDLFWSHDIDVVFILTSDEFHEPYAIAALAAGKDVMIEKPISLSVPSAERIIEAEKFAAGPRVFVGYMRRYAASFTQAFKREIESIPRVLYARARDFSGPNKKFVTESGTFPVKNVDFPSNSGKERARRAESLLSEAFRGRPVTEQRSNFCRFLGSLGSHDLSLMREVFGLPQSVAGVSANHPFYSAILSYQMSDGHAFAVTYESGIDQVPEFDAHLAVYGEKKRVMIQYDSPYVKGLPIRVRVEEVNERGEMERRDTLSSYEDAYTSELQDLYECLVNGKKIKTSCTDALEDLTLFDMIYEKWEVQQPSTNGTNGHGSLSLSKRHGGDAAAHLAKR